MNPEQVREAKALRKAGKTFAEIARHLGVTAKTVRRAIDPGYARHLREQVREARIQKKRAEEIDRPGPSSANDSRIRAVQRRRNEEKKIAERLAALPPDTRTLTGRLMGDPIPGRHVPMPEDQKDAK